MSVISLAKGYLVLPYIRVQNANCISSPLTWGFPSLTNFSGLMVALERKLGVNSGIRFEQFAVVCHRFEPQIHQNDYLNRFNLTRNPLNERCKTPAIHEEGRAHMEISLLFDVRFDVEQHGTPDEQALLAGKVLEALQCLRIAGGSVIASCKTRGRRTRPALYYFDDTWLKKWKQIRYQLLPGFTLVNATKLIQTRLSEMKQVNASSTLLDAWLHESRLNLKAVELENSDSVTVDIGIEKKVEWVVEKRHGWIVPIPIGYAPIYARQNAGTVANARDQNIPVQFAETIYGLGQWISPHRIQTIDSMFWKTLAPDSQGVCVVSNSFESTNQ